MSNAMADANVCAAIQRCDIRHAIAQMCMIYVHHYSVMHVCVLLILRMNYSYA